MCSNDSRNIIEFLHKKKEKEKCSDKNVNLVLRVAKNNHSKINIISVRTIQDKTNHPRHYDWQILKNIEKNTSR